MPSLRHHLDLASLALKDGPHPASARRDAELLLTHTLKKSRAWLMAHDDELLSDDLSISYTELLERRRRGEPTQYITGETEFYGLPFRVTSDVLIPRPETEHLVERAMHLIPVFDNRTKRFFSFHRVRPATHNGENEQNRIDPHKVGWPPRILDVGTGSGCIAISIAHDWSEAEITAIDLSASALEVARFNAESLGFADQIRFLQGDLLTPVAGEQFELIVSNPPYVSTADRATLSVEVREYEPALSLFAGNDGLVVYRRLIPAAFDALVPGGYLVLEIGCGQSTAITELLARAGFEQIEFVPDLQDIPRVACARRPQERFLIAETAPTA
jgi:release factor glutamine methyltransferase